MITQKVIRKPKYAKISKAYEIAVERALLVSVQHVKNEAQQSIQRHGSSGKTYTLYNPKRTHIASAPNNPPNTDTGFLASNIHTQVNRILNEGLVASRAKYSSFLEYGTSKMQPRPFLRRALEETQPKIERLFKRLRIKI